MEIPRDDLIRLAREYLRIADIVSQEELTRDVFVLAYSIDRAAKRKRTEAFIITKP